MFEEKYWKKYISSIFHTLILTTILLSLFLGLTTLFKVVKFSQIEYIGFEIPNSLVYSNILLIILTSAFIFTKLILIFRHNKKGEHGARLQNKLLLMISLIAVTPAVLIFVFCYFFIINTSHYSISPTIAKALNESLSVSEIYIDENEENLANNLRSLKKHVEKNTKKIINSPVEFEKEFSGHAAFLSLTEAVLFIHNEQKNTNKIISKTAFSFIPSVENIDVEIDFIPNELGYQIVFNNDDNYLRAITKIDTLPNAYIVVGKLVNDIAVRHITNAKMAEIDFNNLQNDINSFRENLTLVFMIVVVLVILTSELIAIYLASFFTKPLAQIVEASENLRKGNFKYRVNDDIKIAELKIVISSFNDMLEIINKDKANMDYSNQLINNHVEFLKELLGKLPTAVVLLGVNKEVKLFNRKAEDILDKKQISERDLTIFLPQLEKCLSKAEKKPLEASSFEFNVKINGKTRKLLLYVFLDIYDGEIKGYVLNFCEINNSSTYE